MRKICLKCFLIFLLPVIIAAPLKTQESGPGKGKKPEIEVVSNPLEPRHIKNLPSKITLIEEMEIDPEKIEPEKFIVFGVFDVDTDGNIYIYDPKLVRIAVFDKQGVFQKSIGRKGQGPGEMRFVRNIYTRSHELIVTDILNRKFSVYQKDGKFIKDIKFNKSVSDGVLLTNGNFLFSEMAFPTREEKEIKLVLSLYNPDFQKIRELCAMVMFNPRGSQVKGVHYNLSFSISEDKIFIGNKEKNYEIHVYNFDGESVRIIQKEYSPITPSREYKNGYKDMLGKFYDRLKDKLVFPEYLPPFYDFLLDEEGRLFVMTYEKKESGQGYVFDIFSPGGILFARKSIHARMTGDGLMAKIRNNRLYIVCEDEGEEDRQTLKVYKIKWD